MRAIEFLRYVKQDCEIIDLEQIHYPTAFGLTSRYPFGSNKFHYFLHKRHRDPILQGRPGRMSSASGLITMTDHDGTHIDALCHHGNDGYVFGKTKIDEELETPGGFTRLGSDEIAPIFARGALVDIARFSGEGSLPDRHLITVDELVETLKKENLEVKEGDVVLVRTGYGKYWKEPQKYGSAPGVSKEVSTWLREKKVFAVGADNAGWDLIDMKAGPDDLVPGHVVLIAEGGIHIMENLDLEALSEKKTYEFVFIGLPPRLKGTTGSPIRPIAIVDIQR
jgi:kynurenine formamidase